MSAHLSPPTATPASTINLPAARTADGKPGRAASFPLVLGASRQSVNLDVGQLPPSQAFGPIGTIFVDNTFNLQLLTVLFPDTQTMAEVPAGAAVYVLAITGGSLVTISSPVAVNTVVTVQFLNFIAGPTGVQPVFGTVTVSGGTFTLAGPVTVANPGPATGLAIDRTGAAQPVATSQQLIASNANRKYYLGQFPNTSDGYLNYTGAPAGPGLVGSFYFQAGEKFYSDVFTVTNQINIYVTSGGLVPVIEG